MKSLIRELSPAQSGMFGEGSPTEGSLPFCKIVQEALEKKIYEAVHGIRLDLMKREFSS